MTIPANITAEIAALQAQVTAAAPLNAASTPTKTALKLNAAQLVDDVQSALVADTLLDTWSAPGDPVSIIAGINGVVSDATDQAGLSLMRGVVGRVAANLDSLP